MLMPRFRLGWWGGWWGHPSDGQPEKKSSLELGCVRVGALEMCRSRGLVESSESGLCWAVNCGMRERRGSPRDSASCNLPQPRGMFLNWE